MGRDGRQHAASGGDGSQGLAQLLSGIAHDLREQRGVPDMLDAVVLAATTNIAGASHASITAVRRRREVRTQAASSDLARAVDQAQYDAQQGPCLDTLFQHMTVRVLDTATEERWPEFVATVRELGVASMLCVQLFVQGDDLGALNLSSDRPNAFDEEAEQLALLLASHAAIAMSDAQEQDSLRRALLTRDVVGQAKGILMERHKLTADQAFALLVKASQDGNRKLHEVAREVVYSGLVG